MTLLKAIGALKVPGDWKDLLSKHHLQRLSGISKAPIEQTGISSKQQQRKISMGHNQ